MARVPAGSSHPTRQELIRATRAWLNQDAVRNFTLEDVLAETFTSKGAFYHHFADLNELIEVALSDIFKDIIDADISSLRSLLENADSPENFHFALRTSADITFSRTRVHVRRQRLRIMAALADETSHLREGIMSNTRHVVEALADLIRRAQERELVALDVNAQATAQLLLGMIYGHVFIELGLPDTDAVESASAYVRLLQGIIIAPSA